MSDLRKQVAANFTKTAFAGTGAVMPMMYGSGGGGMGGGMRGGMGYAKGGLVIPKTSKNLAKRLAGKKGAESKKMKYAERMREVGENKGKKDEPDKKDSQKDAK